MATVVTELPINEIVIPKTPTCWCLNVISDNASTAKEIRAAEAGKSHWVEYISITPATGGGNQWIKLFNGEDTLLGPIIVNDGTTWYHKFSKELCGTENTAITVQTQSNYVFHLLVESKTQTS